MEDYTYSGPRVRRTPQSVAAVSRRAERLIALETAQRFEAARAEWARSAGGSFPDPAAIRAQVQRDLETLCRGLDGWAAVDPTDVFGAEPHRGYFDVDY